VNRERLPPDAPETAVFNPPNDRQGREATANEVTQPGWTRVMARGGDTQVLPQAGGTGVMAKPGRPSPSAGWARTIPTAGRTDEERTARSWRRATAVGGMVVALALAITLLARTHMTVVDNIPAKSPVAVPPARIPAAVSSASGGPLAPAAVAPSPTGPPAAVVSPALGIGLNTANSKAHVHRRPVRHTRKGVPLLR